MDDDKIIQFPGKKEDSKEEPKVDTAEPIQIDPDDPLKDKDKIEAILKNNEILLAVLEQQFRSGADELQIKDEHLRQLTAWNENHMKVMPDDLSDEEKDKWDYWNGLDCITEEELEKIFGNEHKVYGLSHEATIDRIKSVCQDFRAWLIAMRDYRNLHDAYLKLLELEEEKQIIELKHIAEDEPDDSKRAVMLKAVDDYYDNKFLGFLARPLEDKERDRLLNAISDGKKLDYWIKRTRDKLDQLKISQKFILELSQFEKRFMEEKYHKNSNMLLVWFLNTCAFCNAGDKTDKSRIKIVCIVMAMDAVIRKTWSQERIDLVMDHIKAFEDQFLPYTKEPEEKHEVTPPIKEEDSNDQQGTD